MFYHVEASLGINLPGFNNDNHLEVKNPTNSSVNAAVNSLVGKWHDTYGTEKFKNTPANFEYSYAMAYSLSQLKTKFGASFEKLKVPLNIDLKQFIKGKNKFK